MLTRAYADWSRRSTPSTAGSWCRAVDLVQLFPAAAYGKNGADIRLAVDTVEDMFRLPDLTHVVIVAGDSDYVAARAALQAAGPVRRRHRRGRFDREVAGRRVRRVRHLRRAARGAGVRAESRTRRGRGEPGAEAGTEAAAPPKKRRRAARPADNEEPEEPDPQATATGLLKRALQIGLEKDDADWLHNSAVKAQMKRMDPSFSEKPLGFRSFSDFLRSRSDVVELDESSTTRMVRLK